MIMDGKMFKNTPTRAGLPRGASSIRQDHVRRARQRASEARRAGSREAGRCCSSSRMIDPGACANDKLTPQQIHCARGGFQVRRVSTTSWWCVQRMTVLCLWQTVKQPLLEESASAGVPHMPE